jgi:hypothetical protein
VDGTTGYDTRLLAKFRRDILTNSDYRTWIQRVSAITEEERGRQKANEAKAVPFQAAFFCCSLAYLY